MVYISKEQAKESIIKLVNEQCIILSKDPEWSVCRWTFIKEITASFSYYAVRQCNKRFCPRNLESVLKHLSFHLWEKFKALPGAQIVMNDDESMAFISLLNIYKWLNEFILYDEECFKWCNANQGIKDLEGYINLRVLIHNVCNTILSERMITDAVSKKV